MKKRSTKVCYTWTGPQRDPGKTKNYLVLCVKENLRSSDLACPNLLEMEHPDLNLRKSLVFTLIFLQRPPSFDKDLSDFLEQGAPRL